MYIGIHTQTTHYPCNFDETWIFPTNLWKILKYQISWKSVLWKMSCSMWTDGQTWRN